MQICKILQMLFRILNNTDKNKIVQNVTIFMGDTNQKLIHRVPAWKEETVFVICTILQICKNSYREKLKWSTTSFLSRGLISRLNG